MTTEPTGPDFSSRKFSSSITISTGRRPMLAMYEFSLQNTHCHGHTRLVRMVATAGGPQPHSGSSGQLNLRASFQLAGLGHSRRSIIGQSAMDLAPVPRITRGKACGSRTRSTMTFSPGPWQILSNSATAVISSSATVACMPPVITRPLGLTSLKICAER